MRELEPGFKWNESMSWKVFWKCCCALGAYFPDSLLTSRPFSIRLLGFEMSNG